MICSTKLLVFYLIHLKWCDMRLYQKPHQIWQQLPQWKEILPSRASDWIHPNLVLYGSPQSFSILYHETQRCFDLMDLYQRTYMIKHRAFSISGWVCETVISFISYYIFPYFVTSRVLEDQILILKNIFDDLHFYISLSIPDNRLSF